MALSCAYESGRLTLGGELVVQELAAAQPAFTEAAAWADALVVDAARVERVDAAGLQMLTSLLKSRGPQAAVLAEPPALLRRAWELAGLGPELAPFLR
jgi:ABC-type transporter Mla MlaB component